MLFRSPKTIAHKKLKPIVAESLKNYFKRNDLVVFTQTLEFKTWVEAQVQKQQVLLLMSSGTFDGIDLDAWGQELGKKVGLT